MKYGTDRSPLQILIQNASLWTLHGPQGSAPGTDRDRRQSDGKDGGEVSMILDV